MMDPKDAGFIQKNIEKLVLGVSVILLLGTAYYFTMWGPFSVDINGRDVKPAEIKPDFERRVSQLESKLNDDQSALPVRDIPDYASAFKQEMASMPTTMATMAPLAYNGLGPDVVPPDGELPTYDLPHPPIADGVLTRKGHAVLSDDIRTLEMEGLIKLIGNNQPRDFQYVSVSATFDMDEWIKRLQSGDKDSRVPARWWNSMIGVAGVQLQRQELDETTGEWINTVYVDPIPGQTAFNPAEVFEATNQQSKEAIQFVRTNQEVIVRPNFPQTRGNILWSPPNEDSQELDAEGQRKLARINGQIANYKEQIQRMQEAMVKEAEAAARRGAAEGDRTRRAPAQRAARGGGGYGGEGGGGYGGEGAGGYGGEGGGGRAARQPRGQNTETPQTPQERINLLQQQLIDAKIERDKLLGIQSDVISRSGYSGGYGGEGGMGMGGYGGEGMGGYGGYGEGGMGMGGYGGGYGEGGMGMGGYGGGYGGGMDPYGGGYGGYGQTGGYGAGGVGTDAAAEPESRKIQVWAHDLSIEPGKTYRYRVVVSVLNPLYRQKRIADAQREVHYDRIALGPDEQELNASPWSEPVHVDSEYYFFMVKGSTNSARVEVWRVYNGKWVNEEFEVRPGDPIGGQIVTTSSGRELKLDLNVGKVVVDLVSTGGGFGGNDVKMLYLNPDDNRIAERTIEDDRNNADRIRLQNEQALEAELALSASPTALGTQ